MSAFDKSHRPTPAGMLLYVKVTTCPNCQRPRLLKQGTTASVAQRYLCRACGKSRVQEPKQTTSTDHQKGRLFKGRLLAA